MPPGSRSLVAAVAIAIGVAGCGAGASPRGGGPQARRILSPKPVSTAARSSLPAGWNELRLTSGAQLPYPPGWRRVSGDLGSASAALVGASGMIRAYLNATPADRQETPVGWARFRVRHNVAEGDRDVRVITARGGVRLGPGRASCVVDEYATSRSRYRELACILVPTNERRATVLIAAAQPNLWAHERPLLKFALAHFTS